MKIKDYLTEATVDDAIKGAEKAAYSNSEGTVEKVLDRALKTARRMQKTGGKEFPNVMFRGAAGSGKTAKVEAWAANNGINLVSYKASSLDPTDFGGAVAPDAETKTVRRYANDEWSILDRPNTVLFLDEYNRAKSSARDPLLALVNEHTVPDVREESGKRYLPNLLFTIACVNPNDGTYDVHAMDPAHVGRFYTIDVVPNALDTLGYLEHHYNKELSATKDPEEQKEIQGRLNLAKALLSNKSFEFDNAEEVSAAAESESASLSPRTFTKALEFCDGTKEDFLFYWNGNCNPTKKSMVERILANYEDVDDKANDAIKGDTESDVFKQKPASMWDKIQGSL